MPMTKLSENVHAISRHLKNSKDMVRRHLSAVDKKFNLVAIILSLLCGLTLPLALQTIQRDEELPFSADQLLDETMADASSASEDILETQLEPVHEDLGDEPVEAQQELSLEEFEKRAILGELNVTHYTMVKGDSLLGLLADHNVPPNERMEIVEALELLLDLKSLRPGLAFMFFHNQEGRLEGLSLRPKANESLAVLREKDDSWVTFSQTGKVETRQEHIQVVIERTFAGSAQKAGVPNNIIAQVTAALDGEFDLGTEVKPNDTVDIILETKVTQGGIEIGNKQLLYIGLKTPSKE